MTNDLIKWKEEYGSIYIIDLEDIPIYYRTLTGWETQSILDLKSSSRAQLDIDNAIIQLACLSKIPNFSKPGSTTSLAQEIWNKSTLTDEGLAIIKKPTREWAEQAVFTNFNIALSSLLCRVLPSLDLVTLLGLTTSKLLRIAALVETVTEIKVLDSGNSTNKKQMPIKEEYGISSQQAQQVNDALSQALNKLKK